MLPFPNIKRNRQVLGYKHIFDLHQMAKIKKYGSIQITKPMDIEDLNRKNQVKLIIPNIVNKANTIHTNYQVMKKQFIPLKVILIKICNYALYSINLNKMMKILSKIKKKVIQHITLYLNTLITKIKEFLKQHKYKS